ncbi:hypothetical protein NLJ89_g9920 [Agrocybe chaxingu]|uniref:Uncharacterized protein n=1 Tax=Agrocybe chaxingu TaxID=84603 RepID=A0A9W8JZN6_9AGAR|nr:hypothetical protein NLJ89_g9920 [Agrocybe chaxingu]
MFDNDVQQEDIRVMVELVRRSRLPIRVLIASRPEPHIMNVFDIDEALRLVGEEKIYQRTGVLHRTFATLVAKFGEIHSHTNLDHGPPKKTSRNLVQKSSGQFMYVDL